MKGIFLPNLRDPIWQAIGVLIGVFAIVVSTLVSYDVYRRSVRASDLTISELFNFDPLRFGETLKGRVYCPNRIERKPPLI